MLHKRSIKEKLLKGGAWAFAGKLVTALSGLAISALLARLLTPEEMGAYFLTFSLVSVAAIFAQMGMTQTVVRFVAESMATDRLGRARQSVLIVMRLAALSSLVVACILAFGAGQWIAEYAFKSSMMANIMGLVAVWVVIITFQQLMAEVYRGFHDIRLATIFGGLTTSILSMILFVSLWLLQGQSNLEQIIILTLGAGISSVLISSALLWNKLKKIPTMKEDTLTKSLLMVSMPFWITNVAIFVLTQAGLWIMGLYQSTEDVAIYGAAVRVVTLLTMTLLIVNAVVPPLIAEMFAQKKIRELEDTLRTVATLAALPSIILLGIFVMFGDSILSLMFGAFYQAGWGVLIILSVGQLVNVLAGSCGQVLMLTGNQVTMMLITISCGVLTVLLSWWLVIDFGGVGVAMSAAISMVLQNILMLFYAKTKVGVWTHMRFTSLNKIRGFA